MNQKSSAGLIQILYQTFPRPLRVFAGSIASYVYELVRPLRPDVWSVAGEVQGSRLPLSVYLCTTTPQYKTYLLQLIFGSSFRATYLGRTWLWNVFTVPKAASDCSILFSEVDLPYLKLLGKRGGIVIPAWVRGEASLPRDPAAKKSKSVQDVLRRIRQHSFEFEITRDPGRFDDFYQDMYVPYIRARYGDVTYLESKDTLKTQFDGGELLFVKKHGVCISGVLIHYDATCAYLRYVGVLNGTWDHVRDGAIVAAYEFCFRHLERNGYPKAGLGLSRAFLRDGALRQKRKWGHRIVYASNHKFLMQIRSDSKATRAFLENNPFIFERSGEFHGAVFLNNEKLPASESLQEIREQYFHRGLSTLVVYCFASGESAMQIEIKSGYARMSTAEWSELSSGLGCIGTGVAFAIQSDEAQAASD